jgi:hypothetical protein
MKNMNSKSLGWMFLFLLGFSTICAQEIIMDPSEVEVQKDTIKNKMRMKVDGIIATVGDHFIMDSDIAIVGHEVSDDNDQIAACISDEGAISITGSADPSTAHGYVYAALRNQCVPDWDIVAAGTHTTAGGGAAEAITVAGVLATDIAFACYGATDDSDVVSDVVCSANTVTVT